MVGALGECWFAFLDAKAIYKLTDAHKRRKYIKKIPAQTGHLRDSLNAKWFGPTNSEYAVRRAHITSAIRRIIYFSTLRSVFQRNTHSITSCILRRRPSTHLFKILRSLTSRRSEDGKKFTCRKAVLLCDQIHIRAARSGLQNKSEENIMPKFKSSKNWIRPAFASHCHSQWYARY